MTISFQCTGCDRTLKVADELAGRKAKCPKCQTVLVIPEGEPAAVTEAPSPPRKKAAAPAAPPPEESLENLDEPDPEKGEERVGKKRKKKGKKSLLPILLIGGGLLLFVCGGGATAVGVWWFFFTGGGSDDYYFLPDNPQMVAVVHMEALLNSGAAQQVRTEFPDFNQQIIKAGNQSAGMDPTNIDRMLIGGQSQSGGTGTPNVVVVMHTKQPVKAADIEAGAKKDNPDVDFTEVKVGRYTMYEAKTSKPTPTGQPPLSFTMPEDRRVVLAPAVLLRTILGRDKAPVFSDKLQAAINQTDFNATVAFAANAKEAFPKQSGMPGGMGGPAGAANPFEKLDGLSVTANVAADVNVKVTGLCPDAASANEVRDTVKKTLDGYRAMLTLFGGGKTPPEVLDLLSIDPQVSGSTVTASKTIVVAPLIKFAKAQKAPPLGLPKPGKQP